MTMILQTPKQKAQAQADAKVWREYKNLAKVEGSSKVAIREYLGKKHGKSAITIWVMCKRAKALEEAKTKAYYGDDDSRAE
jgi:hypothetical protein